jgi:hypothetical protein
MDNRLIDKKFNVPLGIVNCGLISDSLFVELIDNRPYEHGQSVIFKLTDYQIELIEFKVRLPLHNGGTVTDSNGWIWRIIKLQNTSEKIQIDCKLIEPISNISYDTAAGEHLDAIEASNNDWILHIGTEDGEILNSRAKIDDWFPNRLNNLVNFYQSITVMSKNGFVTKIPDLRVGERLHIQYICAYDKNSNRDNVNTWLAVDVLKRNLENWIGI